MAEQTNPGWLAVARLYHSYTTGFALTAVSRRDAREAAAVWFRVFRRQHLDMFLPGIEKLGISNLPDAVKAAQYHYLSNRAGGVSVEYMYESDRKAWVRFPPPRWIWNGTAMCGIPSEVSRAMLEGWYGHNGIALGNPRLGFVCTAQGVDGQHGLAGYFREYDHDLKDDERLRFSPGEEPPPFDENTAPDFDRDAWPPARKAKAHRNYSMNFTKTVLAESAAEFGPTEAAQLGNLTGRLIGMQYFNETADMLGIEDDHPAAFGRYLTLMAEAQDDPVEIEEKGGAVHVRQSGWRLMRGCENISSSAFEAWNGLWQGALLAHNRFLALEVLQRMDYGDDCFEWRIRERGASKLG